MAQFWFPLLIIRVNVFNLIIRLRRLNRQMKLSELCLFFKPLTDPCYNWHFNIRFFKNYQNPWLTKRLASQSTFPSFLVSTSCSSTSIFPEQVLFIHFLYFFILVFITVRCPHYFLTCTVFSAAISQGRSYTQLVLILCNVLPTKRRYSPNFVDHF